ncbi:hypothetical protein [Paraburkholderia bannensis]|uniref:hypothetical protein n=1 Tax=Paraburkholderia bannensis TaxID=765414 RepID=UPI002AB6A21D|nr:hypothetical protein [Paraburkholderia bannensis]
MIPTHLPRAGGPADIAMPGTPAQTSGDSHAARNAGASSQREVHGALEPLSRSQSLASGASGSRRRVSLPQTAPAPAPALTPAETPQARAQRQEGVHAAVSGYFMPHVTDGEDTNRDALNALIDDRVQGLMAMGETQASIEATFAKGWWHDVGAEGARGFVGSIPFGVASRLLDTEPVIGGAVVAGLNVLPVVKDAPAAFKGGAAAGLVSGVADHIGSQALTPAMKDVQWLSSSAENLEETMAEAKTRADAGMLRTVGQNATAIQTFTARNVVRGIVGPAMTAAGHAAAAVETDSWLAAIGSPLSGAGFNLVNRHFAEQDHRVGPEYLLGRTDWQDQYRALKDATWKGAVANGAGRFAKAVVNTLDATVSAPRTILSATGITTNVGALGAGLGAVSMATTGAGALAKQHGAGAAGVVAAEHLGRTLSSAAVFASWTTAGIVTQPAVDGLRAGSDAAGDRVKDGVSSALHASAAAIGDWAEQGANFVAPRLRNARDAAIQTGQQVVEGASRGVDRLAAATGNAFNAISTAINANLNNTGVGASGNPGDAATEMRRRARVALTSEPGQNPQDIALDDRSAQGRPA